MIEVSEVDKRKHREVEKELKAVSAFRWGVRGAQVDIGHSFIQAKAKLAQQVKVIGGVVWR